MTQRFFLPLLLIALLGAACMPAAPTLEPAVQTELAAIDAQDGRPVGRYGIFTTSLDGADVEQIYGGTRLRNSVRISPDGEWLVYVEYTADRNNDGLTNEGDVESAEIGLMRLDGSEAHLLTSNEAIDIAPSWAPDGKHILFASDRDSEDEEKVFLDLYVMDLEGENITQIYPTPDIIETDTSWTDDTIVFVYYDPEEEVQSLWRMACSVEALDACGEELRPLTAPTFEKTSEVGYVFGDFEPKVSPDGETVVFYRHLNEDWSIGNFPIGDWDIYTIPLDGEPGDETLITEGDEADVMPVWSPDGEQLAFWMLTDDFENLGDIFVIDAEGGEPQKVEGEIDLYYAQMPEWIAPAYLEDSDEPRILFTAEWVDGGRQEEQ